MLQRSLWINRRGQQDVHAPPGHGLGGLLRIRWNLDVLVVRPDVEHAIVDTGGLRAER